MMNKNPFTVKHDPLVQAAQGVLAEADAKPFFRLPGHVINNELYVAGKTMQQIIATATDGNDFNPDTFNNLLLLLKKIKGEVKEFEANTKLEDIPLVYQYKSK